MIVAVTFEASERLRRAVRRYHGRRGLATQRELCELADRTITALFEDICAEVDKVDSLRLCRARNAETKTRCCLARGHTTAHQDADCTQRW